MKEHLRIELSGNVARIILAIAVAIGVLLLIVR